MRTRKLRIAFISRTRFGVMGGAATYQFATKVNDFHEVRVFSPDDPTSHEPIVYRNPDVTVTDIYSPNRIQQINTLYAGISEFRPHIVHMLQNPLCLDYCYYARHAEPESRWLMDFRSPHVGDPDSPILKRYWYVQFYVDRILTHSLESLKTNMHWRFRPAIEVPPGVEITGITSRELGGTDVERPRRWVFIGSISKTRQIDVLCEGFLRFAEAAPEPVTLDIFGAGNAFNSVRDYVEQRGGSQQISLRGTMEQNELFRILSTYDAGIAYVPHEFFSSAPSLKSLEYAAAGLPIVASNTLGHRAYRDRFGFHYELFENDPDSIFSTFQRISRQGIPLERTRKNLALVKNFDWRKIVESKLLPLYEKLVHA